MIEAELREQVDAIRIAGLTRQYRSSIPFRVPPARPAVDHLDLTVPAGSITALLGPNGAGKTTAVKLLLGLLRADHGECSVFGLDMKVASLAARSRIAYVPQERSVLGWMRVGAFVHGIRSFSPRWDDGIASRLLNDWRIDARQRLRALSTGTRSSLLLIVALARRASLLVLDEPTIGLDPANVEQALSELAASAADGATILLVTHRLEEVERICDRVAIMNEGRLVLEESLDDLRTDWRIIEVAGEFSLPKLQSWEEVVSATPFGADDDAHMQHVRLLVSSAPDAVVQRARLIGAEVTSVRALTLREIYLALTRQPG